MWRLQAGRSATSLQEKPDGKKQKLSVYLMMVFLSLLSLCTLLYVSYCNCV